MGVIHTKPKVYYSVPTKSTVDTCAEFSSINMTNYTQKDGVCTLSLLFKNPTGIECLKQIKEVENLLQKMVDKYEKQYDEMHNDLIVAVKAKQRKDVLIHKLRRKKLFYII